MGEVRSRGYNGAEGLASPPRPLEKGVGLMAMKSVAMIVIAALAVCVLAVTLAVLLVPSLAWADVLGWLTTTPPCEAPCD